MWVYIMANRYRGTIYVGVTNQLSRRIGEHKAGAGSDFVRRYGLARLVFAERHEDAREAIAHEKRLKRWARAWKIALIETSNPDWADLADTIHLD